MADIVIIPSPLRAERQSMPLPVGMRFSDWLADYVARSPYRLGEPQLFEQGENVPDLDFLIEPDASYLLVFRPALPIAGIAIFWQILAATLVSTAISAVVALIFRPKRPSASNTPEPSPVYSLSPPQNTARLGEPIPVIYGEVIQVPPLAMQSYAEYVNNDQFINELLCVGQGFHTIKEILIGDSTISGLPAGVVLWWAFSPTQHGGTFGTIQNSSGILENVVTSREIADQELLASNQITSSVPSTWYWRASNNRVVFDTKPPGVLDSPNQLPLAPQPALGTVMTAIYSHHIGAHEEYWNLADFTAVAMDPGPYPALSVIPPPTQTSAGSLQYVGWFDMTKPGQHGQRAMLDFVFPGGLVKQAGDGTFAAASVTVQVEFLPINDVGDIVGGVTTFQQVFNGQTNTPQRFTRTMDLPSAARWRCRCVRTTLSDNKTSTSDRVIWTGMKLLVTDVAIGAPAYGNVTLLALRIKASNGIASDAASSIRCRVMRQLVKLADPGQPLADTRNPADAFADILCSNYGANRPRATELDLDTLGAMWNKWYGRNGFNAVFDQKSTVWEALQLSVQSVFAAPLPLGQKMSLVEDDKKPTRLAMFSELNIVPQSLAIGYEFDKIGEPGGTRVEYRDPISFLPAFVILPDGATDVKNLTLFGCTDRAVATQHCQLDQARHALQRKSLSFDCELEGLILRVGDRFALSHQLARWGQAARLVSVTSATLTLDRPLDWSVGTGGTGFAVLLRDPQGNPLQINGVYRGSNDSEVVLSSTPPAWLIGQPNELEPTHVYLGDTVREISDWICTAMAPREEPLVSIEAVNYEPAIYPW